jgi:hypothetical protein
MGCGGSSVSAIDIIFRAVRMVVSPPERRIHHGVMRTRRAGREMHAAHASKHHVDGWFRPEFAGGPPVDPCPLVRDVAKNGDDRQVWPRFGSGQVPLRKRVGTQPKVSF